MLHWQKTYSRSRLTMTAHSETAHTLVIISTGITNPVHVYETAPGQKGKTRFATVPSIELAMLAAEDRNTVNLRGTAGSAEAQPGPLGDRRERARKILDELETGPKDYFIIEVPKTQSLNAQRTLELAGLHLRMAPHHPSPRLPAALHSPANADLPSGQGRQRRPGPGRPPTTAQAPRHPGHPGPPGPMAGLPAPRVRMGPRPEHHSPAVGKTRRGLAHHGVALPPDPRGPRRDHPPLTGPKGDHLAHTSDTALPR